MVGAMEEAGFEVRDVESLREHYALHAAAWVANLEAAGTRRWRWSAPGRARVWRLYMAGSALGFERRRHRHRPGARSAAGSRRQQWHAAQQARRCWAAEPARQAPRPRIQALSPAASRSRGQVRAKPGCRSEQLDLRLGHPAQVQALLVGHDRDPLHRLGDDGDVAPAAVVVQQLVQARTAAAVDPRLLAGLAQHRLPGRLVAVPQRRRARPQVSAAGRPARPVLHERLDPGPRRGGAAAAPQRRAAPVPVPLGAAAQPCRHRACGQPSSRRSSLAVACASA